MSIRTKNDVLSDIEAKRGEWLNDDCYSVHTIDSLSIDDNGIYVDDMQLGERAVSKMLYRMQLTEKFIDYKDEVEKGDFKSVFNNIATWNRGKQIVTRSNGSSVSDVFFYRGDGPFSPGSRLCTIIDGVTEKIAEMPDGAEIHNFDINTDSKNIRFSTVDPSTRFDAIGDDKWVLGSILSIGLTDAFASPYYGRLICMNGMVDGIKMRKFSLSGKSYTEDSIRHVISKGTNLKKLAADHIMEVSKNAVGCEASLSEYLMFRKIMMAGLTEDQKETADTLFPLYHIEDAYGGKEVFDNNDRWKSTAKAGVTVYELLNDITKWTTHDSSINNQTMKNRLNEKASTWFMKGEWHNRNVAPSVNVRRKPRFDDSVALV